MQYLRWFIVICLIIVLLLNLYKKNMISKKNIKHIIWVVFWTVIVIAMIGIIIIIM